jgi:selenide,water dikinase
VRIELDGDTLPFYRGALEAAEAGVRTGGDARNRAHLEGHVLSDAPPAVEALAFDPQTSGGLLAAVAPQFAPDLWHLVGRVVDGPPGVHLRWGD